MKNTSRRDSVPAVWSTMITVLLLIIVPQVHAEPAQSEPELVMRQFIQSFQDYDYDACRALLSPGATVSITRRYPGKPYVSTHQDALIWLGEVGSSGVREVEGFEIEVHETMGLLHDHGATVIVRFTASGMAERGKFSNLGFDTGSLIRTDEGWRIQHYSSFEEFQWGT